MEPRCSCRHVDTASDLMPAGGSAVLKGMSSEAIDRQLLGKIKCQNMSKHGLKPVDSHLEHRAVLLIAHLG